VQQRQPRVVDAIIVTGGAILADVVPIASSYRRASLLLSALILAGCHSEPARAPAIGEAYAGPATLVLRQDLNPRSPEAVTVRHGDRLEIVQRRRRFLKVRNAAGREGWTEEHFLLSPQEIARLKTFSESVRNMASQGAATTYEAVGVHSEPARMSPSFLTIKEGEKFDVIAREVAPRRAMPRAPLVKPKPVKSASAKKPAKRKADALPPPPAPPPPKPPADWVELSGAQSGAEPLKPAVPAEPEPVDDWTLIRTASGESGWILSRRVSMSIPDEVAQYAEGRRITSYFRIGEVRDNDTVKPTWLWTTVEQSLQAHDFDSFRVFVWSLRHHRYETSFIQRRVRGYFPVLAKAGSFSVCLEKDDGTRYRRGYAFAGYQVRATGDTACDGRKPEIAPESKPPRLTPVPPEGLVPAPATSLYARVKDRLRTMYPRWFSW
jgi:SH3-like domain-containing protein